MRRPVRRIRVETLPHSPGKRQDFRRDHHQVVEQRVAIHLRLAQTRQQDVVVFEQIVDPVAKRLRIGKIAKPHGAPTDPVLVGRPNATPSGSDRRFAARHLARPVERTVER